MSFINALQTNNLSTENNMPTHSTSGNYLVDFFYRLGASRNDSEEAILKSFQMAWFENSPEDALNALKALFYGRDVREGQGERRMFRIILKWLAENHPYNVSNNLHNIPFYGRFDDLFVILDSDTIPALKEKTVDFILNELKTDNKLANKWMPRENKSRKDLAKKFMTWWNLTPKQYRKLLAGNTEVVENLMCSNDWKNIKYESVPSLAMHKYRKAFFKRDEERFKGFVEKAVKGETKINSSTLYPHQIMMSILPRIYGGTNNGNDVYTNALIENASQDEINLAQAQWNNLPNWVREGQSFIPVVDVSGSMQGEPMHVAIALGIYLSERNVGAFKDAFITFSHKPELQVLKGNLYERSKQLLTSGWGMNTNLEKVFNLILSKAVEADLPNEEMPKTIIILSDMQFDQAIINGNNSALEMISEYYALAGFTMPNIVFWNLRNSIGVPVKSNEKGTALVSGFSPSIMKSVMENKTPLEIVLDTLNKERYDRVTL